MTTQTSTEATVRAHAEVWGKRDAESVGRSYAPDAVVIDPAYDSPLKGRESIRKDAADFFGAFPDLATEITQIHTHDSSFSVEGKMSGTHLGPLPLPTGLVPATSRPIEFSFAIFGRLNERREVIEERRYYDVLGQLTQLGLMQ
jgi:hypothetical protein